MPETVYVYAATTLLGAIAVLLCWFVFEGYQHWRRKQNYDRLQRLMSVEDEARKMQR